MTSKRRLHQQVDELSALVDRMQRRWEAQQQAIADVAAALDAIKSRKGTETVTNKQRRTAGVEDVIHYSRTAGLWYR